MIGDYHLSLATALIGLANFLLLVLVLIELWKGKKR